MKASWTNLSKHHRTHTEREIFGDWHATLCARSCRFGVIIIQLLRSAHAQLTLELLQEFHHLMVQTARTGTPSPPSCPSEGVGRVTEQPAAHLSAASSTLPDSPGRYYSSPNTELDTLLDFKSSGTTLSSTALEKQALENSSSLKQLPIKAFQVFVNICACINTFVKTI